MRSLCLNDSASFLALGIFLGIDIGVLSRRALPQSPSSMVQSGDWFILPDLYAALPFNGCQNPLFHIVGKESRDLINSYGVLNPSPPPRRIYPRGTLCLLPPCLQ